MKRDRTSGRIGMIIMIVSAILLIAVIGGRILKLKRQTEDQQARLSQLNTEIAKAQEEKLDIEDEIRYRETDEYIEDQAKGLGLRYPDEMIIVPEDE